MKESGIRIAGDLTPFQRAKLRKLYHEGRRGYYKNGKLHVEDSTPDPPLRPPGQQSEGQLGSHQDHPQRQNSNIWFGRPRDEHHYRRTNHRGRDSTPGRSRGALRGGPRGGHVPGSSRGR